MESLQLMHQFHLTWVRDISFNWFLVYSDISYYEYHMNSFIIYDESKRSILWFLYCSEYSCLYLVFFSVLLVDSRLGVQIEINTRNHCVPYIQITIRPPLNWSNNHSSSFISSVFIWVALDATLSRLDLLYI